MFCVSVLISLDEWQRFQQTAQVMWRGETYREVKSFAGMLWRVSSHCGKPRWMIKRE